MLARASFPPLLASLLLCACGGSGSETAAPQQSAPASQVVSPPRLVTLIGSRESSGLHWIVVGDGFTSGQQEELRASALALGQELIGTPELAKHSAVWNVHVLQAVSAESGVDDAASGQQVNTAFDGALGCGSNSRVACVDWARINAALRAEQAPQAQLTVILNTPVYVGSSNSSGVVISRNANAPRIAVHELGHRVAGLADEYVDDVVAAEWLPLYFEGRFPNVTRQSRADQAPWRHWLEQSGAGVGLYEGAFYVASGFFRPKQDSLMRTLEAPLGEVNAEAWLRAQYRVVPPLTAASPASAQVRGLSGDSLDFSVVSAWPAGTVALQWLVDGMEVPGTAGSTTFRLAADGATHEVEVIARDISGRIRAPDAFEAAARRAWTVSPTAPAGQKMTAATAGTQAWLEVRVDGSGHQLIGRQASTPAATDLARAGEAHWRYTLLDDQGQALATGEIADPRVVRTAMSAPGELHAGHGSGLLESGVYFVGIPQGAEARKLRIASMAGTEKLGWAATMPATVIELPLDQP